MTTQREAKKMSKELVKVVPWESKLLDAVKARNKTLIESYLAAWQGLDARMAQPVGEQRTFRFNPLAVAQAKVLDLKLQSGRGRR